MIGWGVVEAAGRGYIRLPGHGKEEESEESDGETAPEESEDDGLDLLEAELPGWRDVDVEAICRSSCW